MTTTHQLPYSITMLSEATGIPNRTILNHITAGELRAVKLAPNTGAWLIPAEDAARYIAAHTTQDNVA